MRGGLAEDQAYSITPPVVSPSLVRPGGWTSCATSWRLASVLPRDDDWFQGDGPFWDCPEVRVVGSDSETGFEVPGTMSPSPSASPEATTIASSSRSGPTLRIRPSNRPFVVFSSASIGVG